MVPSVLAVITNYDFSANADDLKRQLLPYFETLLIDNSSPTPPADADLILPNGHYTGLWNEAVHLARERRKRWLLFVASDIAIPEPALLAAAVNSVVGKAAVGVYTPALRQDSRASFPACYQRDTGGLRECYVVEGFCFLARTRILQRIHPVDPVVNAYGWGIDVMTAYHAYRTGHRVVVDDRVAIYHPASSHVIDNTTSQAQMIRYVGREGAVFLEWTYACLRRERDLSAPVRRFPERMTQFLRRLRFRFQFASR